MRKSIIWGIALLLLITGFAAFTHITDKTIKGKTITQIYWAEPVGKPRYIDHGITRVVLADGNIYGRTEFANKEVKHQFTADGILYESAEGQETAIHRGEYARLDAMKTKADCIKQGMRSEIIAGFETFYQEKPQGGTGSQIWLCPDLQMTPLRLTFFDPEIKQGVETIAITDGVDPKLIEARDKQALKPKITRAP
jgi:hypothetical protein